jgi:hypothetical protein
VGRSRKPDDGYGLEHLVGMGFSGSGVGFVRFLEGLREPTKKKCAPFRKHPQMTVMSVITVMILRKPLI